MIFKYIAILFLGCFALFSIISTSDAQEENFQELRHDILKLKNKIKQLEVDNLDPELLIKIENEKEALEKINDKLTAKALQISRDQLNLSSNYFSILMGVVALASLISGFVIAGFTKGINAFIRRNVKLRVEEEMFEAINNASYYYVAKVHGQIAFAWWDHYFAELQKFFQKDSFDPSIIRDIKFSKDVAKKGLKQLKELPSSIVANNSLVQLRADLQNHLVYSTTCEALLRNHFEHNNFTTAESDHLKVEATTCLQNSMLVELSNNWFNHVETAQFCFLKFGTEHEKVTAREALLGLFEYEMGVHKHKNTAPSKEFLSFAYENYFPVDKSTSERIDIHHLGRIPNEPPAS